MPRNKIPGEIPSMNSHFMIKCLLKSFNQFGSIRGSYMKPTRSKKAAPTCPWGIVSRRDFLKLSAAAAMAPASLFRVEESHTPKQFPRTPTSVRLCKRYDYPLVLETLRTMLREIGGVVLLVKGKFVTVKVNLVNVAKEHVNGLPLELTVVTHPSVAMALGQVLVEFGAKRVTFCDQLPYAEPSEASFARYGYSPKAFNEAMDGKCRFENTRNVG
ncbi:twin-arginine translocation signal domain-containing protein, partial [bacterium]|nr:twin-arginine translocation signal domain-containing protein [bacterium]